VFWALMSSSEHSGVPEDSQPPTFPSVGLHPHTWPKWGCDKGGILGANVFSSICPIIHPSIRPVIHPWHGGDNHVAIDLIVQHICTKLG